MSIFSTCGWILRLGDHAGAADLDPSRPCAARALRAPDGAHIVMAPRRRADGRGAGAPRAAWRATSSMLATTASPGKEVRVESDRRSARGAAARRLAGWFAPVGAARRNSAVWHALAWTTFGVAFVGAVAFSASLPGRTTAAVLLVLAAGSRLSFYVAATVGEIGFLRGVWLDGSRRLAWLEDYAAAVAGHADADLASSSPTVSGSTTCRSHTREPSVSCSRTSRCTSGPAASWRSLARTAPARARS